MKARTKSVQCCTSLFNRKSNKMENMEPEQKTEDNSQSDENSNIKSPSKENLGVNKESEESLTKEALTKEGLTKEEEAEIDDSLTEESLTKEALTEDGQTEESQTGKGQLEGSSPLKKQSEALKRLPDAVRAKSTCLESNTWQVPVYQVPLEEEQINVDGCRWFRFGKDDMKTNRTIMVMGATGAGKSTLIDGMINYILGVRWEDEYRFKLVKEVQKETQAVSQTSEVTVYKLNYRDGFQINYSLTIIDTPGFGDTRGIERDRQITEQIRNLFTSESGVFEIDAVCFVVQAALARLTPSQRYVFDSVLSIFGKDIAENIRVLVTFADGQRPPVLEAIKASGVPCPLEKGNPVHFKFNNSALFASNNSPTKEEDEDEEEEGFDHMFWDMGNKSMKRFFVALSKIETKSLTMTKEVLTERKQLENLVENLQKQVRVGLSKLEEIKQTSQIVETHQAEISRNKNFEYTVTVTEPVQIDISGTGIFITNCQQCHYTCHDNCAYANDADKIKCCAMRRWKVHCMSKQMHLECAF
ncbi:uncharacterized protein LOC129411020 [Boleophthalmus pectinirostris]|uniref:uncharacterized protein LOC129411020 n=1 Tax=Boleophthalmus pectinirostris TaxID=150288 RepID=UPI00242D16C1|nr:uncharacterized protein LOC129411020 [Boleophthalmus pectinirostris]